MKIANKNGVGWSISCFIWQSHHLSEDILVTGIKGLDLPCEALLRDRDDDSELDATPNHGA